MVKIGFELEINTNQEIEKNSYHENRPRRVRNFFWRFEKDGSLNEETGIEIVSPPFTKRQLKKIKEDLLIIMNDGRWWIDDRCGFHINFSYPGVVDCFLYSRLLFLRKKIIKWISNNYPKTKREFIKAYFRSYAKEIEGYEDYKKSRYLEFNIKEKYIEWRSINLRHFMFNSDTEYLIEQIINLLKYIFFILNESEKIKNDSTGFIYFSYLKETNKQQTIMLYDSFFNFNFNLSLKKIRKKKKTSIKIKSFESLGNYPIDLQV